VGLGPISSALVLKWSPPLRIATWNVNYVRQRITDLLDYLKDASPDALCLQEIKCTDEQFPRLEVEDLGYNVETHGQKGFNGVAILAKRPFEGRAGCPATTPTSSLATSRR
jgi:exodeoxyribonuclease III